MYCRIPDSSTGIIGIGEFVLNQYDLSFRLAQLHTLLKSQNKNGIVENLRIQEPAKPEKKL